MYIENRNGKQFCFMLHKYILHYLIIYSSIAYKSLKWHSYIGKYRNYQPLLPEKKCIFK